MAILQQSSNGEGPITGWPLELCRPGQYLAVCLDVKDSFGIQRPAYEDPTRIETKDVCRFLFGTQDGQMVQTGEITISSHEKSKLSGILTSWTGSPKGVGFDTETLRGKGCMINIIQKTSQKGTVYSDITSITPVMAGMEAQVPQPSQFNIPGKSDISLQNAQNQQVVQNNITPTVTTQQTIDQPQTVSQQISNTAQQAQMFSAPPPAPF